jgi:TatD DNase family protein
MASFLDSHAHLADPAFDEDRDAVIMRAREAGVVGIICIGESPERAESACAIAARYPGFVWFTAGVHPHDAAGFDPLADLDAIKRFLTLGCVAIGECGLDYHYDHSPREQQRRAFALQLGLAREAGLPVVVHTREAEEDTRAMVSEAGNAGVNGVLHCYTG